MARQSGAPLPPLCILLVYGIPGSGKTTLVRHLLKCCHDDQPSVGHPDEFVVVCFDDLLPPDLRYQQSESERDDHARERGAESQEEEDKVSSDHFVMKDERQRIDACIQHLFRSHYNARVEGHQSATLSTTSPPLLSFPPPLPPPPPPPLWEDFIKSISKHSSSAALSGARLSPDRPTVVVLDDNMPLRSMRHTYYQLARKYGTGFAEVLVRCPSSMALQRNSLRPIPIPQTTITAMEQRLESPSPLNHPWERRSVVVQNSGEVDRDMAIACEQVLSLLREALACPVPPLPDEQVIEKQACRVANQDSFIHQADQILRKCVSAAVMSTASQQTVFPKKAVVSQQANAARRQVLEAVRAGRLEEGPSLTSCEPSSAKFKEAVESAFSQHLSQIETHDLYAT